VFLINLIPLHVLTLMATGRFSHRIYVAYSTLYCVGTVLSMQISFVGFQPVQSSEHMLVSAVQTGPSAGSPQHYNSCN
jgi:dolichyl-diphosphooligosaccharide--protein glycosyltransferase